MKNTIVFILAMLFSFTATAQNKVVVVPLGGDTGSAAANAHSGGNLISIVNPNEVTVQTVSVNLPANGHLVANSSFRWYLNSGEGGFCATTLDSTNYPGSSAAVIRGVNSGSADIYDNSSTTDLFTNVSAGNHTVRLICKADLSKTIGIQFPSLTVLFVPGLL